MTHTMEMVAAGNRMAVFLPEELGARLGRPGMHVDSHTVAEGIVAVATDFERQMAVARRVMDEDADAFAILAR